MHESLERIRGICEGSDAIIGNPIALFTGSDAASNDRIPYFLAMLQPGMKTRRVPSVLTPEWPFGAIPGRELYNELTYGLTDVAMWALMRGTVNAARRTAASLPPLHESPIGGHRRRGRPMLVGVSTHVVPPPEEEAPNYAMTGYWFLPSAADYRPPPELAAFLAAGPPPLCVGFGSAAGKEVAEGYRMIVDIARRNRWRTVLLTGWGHLDGELPDHVIAVREAAHDWLLPRVAAFVHHGGAGTTAAALKAGIPMVILPYGADARFWAHRVHDLGAGPRPTGLRTRPDDVEAAIREALGAPHLRSAAGAVAARIAGEDGVARAVEFIERTLGSRSRASSAVADLVVGAESLC
jgi:sterol 3beta-glucosyltransferase